MMKRKFSITLGLILPLILALVSAFTWPTPALAQGPRGDQVVFGDNLVLKAEEKIEGDVIVFGGNVTMPASSEIDGDMVVFGGNADIDGTVTGDIGMIGGNINLGKTAVVKGDIGFLGGNADIAEGAKVEGEVTSLNRFGWDHDEGFSVPPIPPVPSVSPVPPIPPVSTENHIGSEFFDWGGRVFDFFRYVVGNIALLLALAVLSWLVAAFMPEQMKIVGDT
ncbi:MAG TPA: polymer-forming cytoskeletal protein, partial [Anaerolineae bacterium]|nr:polymer-forming cytoskeletal protein [Anaerolineae bacterium]